MLLMLLPILCIEISQFLIMDYGQILSIALFSCFGEVERPSDYRFSVAVNVGLRIKNKLIDPRLEPTPDSYLPNRFHFVFVRRREFPSQFKFINNLVASGP